MDNKVQLYMRPNSPHWQCACSVAGKQLRATTKEESLSRAKDVARDWYLGLLGKYRAGELKAGQEVPRGLRAIRARIRDHYTGPAERQTTSLITSGGSRTTSTPFSEKVVHRHHAGVRIPHSPDEDRIHRSSVRRVGTRTGSRPNAASDALHQEIVCLRQISKVPPTGTVGSTICPICQQPFRAFRAKSRIARGFRSTNIESFTTPRGDGREMNPPKKRWRWSCEQLHDYVLFMANTGLRPDEALRLQFRDVEIVEDEATSETILVIAGARQARRRLLQEHAGRGRAVPALARSPSASRAGCRG